MELAMEPRLAVGKAPYTGTLEFKFILRCQNKQAYEKNLFPEHKFAPFNFTKVNF